MPFFMIFGLVRKLKIGRDSINLFRKRRGSPRIGSISTKICRTYLIDSDGVGTGGLIFQARVSIVMVFKRPNYIIKKE